jgi:hypothetical protein
MSGNETTFSKAFRRTVTRATAFALVAFLITAVCATHAFAQHSARKTFSSPEEAARSLFIAVKQDDDQEMTRILGAGKALIALEDEVQDKQERKQFIEKYREMHRLVREPDRTTVLYIGAENWPFPVPLVSSNGAWQFDPKTGMREVLYRRIGENETKAIEACHALADGNDKQAESSDGNDERPESSIRDLLRTRSDDSASQNKPVQSNGYYFRAIDSQNKAANGDVSKAPGFVAYPVEYRKSGVMTFIVSDDGRIYERDLGPKTRKLANSITRPKPSAGWQQVESDVQ